MLIELVSIITPLYNSQDFIEETISSVLSQSYKNWEMLIVDDHSTDNSFSIVKNHSLKDKRIKLFQTKKNSGAGIARNLAIKKAKGEIIAFLDSDDIWHPDKLKIQLKEMKKAKAVFSHTSYGYINRKGEIMKHSFQVSSTWVSYYCLLKRTEIGCLTAMYDVRAIGKKYMPDLRIKQDYGLWLEILSQGFKSYPININLAWYRQVKDSSTSNKYKLIVPHYLFLRRNQNLKVKESIYYTILWGINGLKRYYQHL